MPFFLDFCLPLLKRKRNIMRKSIVLVLRVLAVWLMLAPAVGVVVSLVKDKPIEIWLFAAVFILGIVLWFYAGRLKPVMCKQCGKVRESDFKCIKTTALGYETFKVDEDRRRKEEVTYRKVEKVYQCPNCGHTFSREELER